VIFLHSNSFNVFSTRCVQSIVFGLKTCLQSSFGLKLCTSVLSLNTLKTFTHYILYGYKKEIGEPSGSSVFLLGCKVLVMKIDKKEMRPPQYECGVVVSFVLKQA